MYNFSELITSHVVIEKGSRKYEYKVNFSVAVHICRDFLLSINNPPDVELLIARYVLPIRPGHSRPREMKVKQAISFMYSIKYQKMYQFLTRVLLLSICRTFF